MSLVRFLRALRGSRSGVAMTEFALAAPLLMVAGLYGSETVWLSITHMRINQTALKIADDASRIGDLSTLENRKIYEADLNDIFYGTHLETDSLDFYAHGRVILSSLEVEPGSASEQQYIHWQRCKGRLDWRSSYGEAGDGAGDPTFTGMGPPGDQVVAMPEDAVMFVEVAYNYQPLFGDVFVSDRLITATAAFNVRDDRDLAGVHQRDDLNPDPIARCDIWDDTDGTAVKTSPAGTGPTFGMPS